MGAPYIYIYIYIYIYDISRLKVNHDVWSGCLASSFASHPHKPEEGLCVCEIVGNPIMVAANPNCRKQRYSQLPVSLAV